MADLPYHETPIVAINDDALTAAGVTLSVKREDLNHPLVSGNKWWKLKLNLADAVSQGYDTLLTFGGAHSNHLYATAAAAAATGLKSIGVVRGIHSEPFNDTLSFARDNGMVLHFVTRERYRDTDALYAYLAGHFGRYYLIPEGGSNEAGVAGVSMFSQSLPSGFDYICCAIGTGATLAGLVRGRNGRGMLIGFPVLKGGDSWRQEVEKFGPRYDNWTIVGDYHGGGYAKHHPLHDAFISNFSSRHSLPLEHVYSGKMFYGIIDLVSRGYFPGGSKILAIHTGGVRPNRQTI